MRLWAVITFAGLMSMLPVESFGQSRNCIVQPQFERSLYEKAQTTKPKIDRPDFEKAKMIRPDFSKSQMARPLVDHPDFEHPKYLDCSGVLSKRTQQSVLWPGFYPTSPVRVETPPAPGVPAPVAKVAVPAVKAEAIAPAPAPMLGFKPTANRGGYFYEAPVRECCGSSSAK